MLGAFMHNKFLPDVVASNLIELLVIGQNIPAGVFLDSVFLFFVPDFIQAARNVLGERFDKITILSDKFLVEPFILYAIP